MKNKDYTSITNILNKKYVGKIFKDTLDFGETLTLINQEFIIENNVFYLPEEYFNKSTKNNKR